MRKLTKEEILKLNVGDLIIVKDSNPTKYDSTGDPNFDLIFEDLEKGNPVEVVGVYTGHVVNVIFNWAGFTDVPIGEWGLSFVSPRRQIETGCLSIQDEEGFEIWKED